MGSVTNIPNMPDHPAQYLLPWYLNGTLDEAESRAVEAHLAECAECRAELEQELGLAARVMEYGSREAEAVEAPPARHPAAAPASAGGGVLRWRMPLGWFLAGQFATAALFLAIFLPRLPSGEAPTYRALGSDSQPATTGNVIVLFAADAREQAVRQALTEAGARVVDGPTASGAYMLHVPIEQREAALQRLRGDPQVALAEPIGGGGN